jgi:hypothetical protein
MVPGMTAPDDGLDPMTMPVRKALVCPDCGHEPAWVGHHPKCPHFNPPQCPVCDTYVGIKSTECRACGTELEPRGPNTVGFRRTDQECLAFQALLDSREL